MIFYSYRIGLSYTNSLRKSHLHQKLLIFLQNVWSKIMYFLLIKVSSIYNHFRKSSTFYSELRLNTLTHNLVDIIHDFIHTIPAPLSVKCTKTSVAWSSFKLLMQLSGGTGSQFFGFGFVTGTYVTFYIFWVWTKLTHL